MNQAKSVADQWKENFLNSDAVRLVEGEQELNFSFVRRLFYGEGNSGGFKGFYTSNIPLEQAESSSDEIITTCMDHLEKLGIEMPRSLLFKIEKSPHGKYFAGILIDNTYSLLKKLANARHQYGIDGTAAINKCNKELHELADLALRFETKKNKPAKEQGFNHYVTIPDNYLDDSFINDLWNKVENTFDNFFITGKAGTGKSTFLHYVARNTKKNVVIAAFTGIAAINIGGTTIHSFFRLPFRPLLPRDNEIPSFSKDNYKRKIIRQMDTLIIDEVSMVRADILEAIDHSLRINGGDRKKPFGGKQIILIGDLFQLPPVVKVDNNLEWQIFEDVYDSPYFFSAQTFKVTPFHFIEMPKIYRQNDQQFKDILNRIRVGDIDNQVLQQLNTRYAPNYEPDKDEFVLTLVTTNKLANAINQRKLQEIKGKEFEYRASLEGDFPSDRYPTDFKLRLRKGAQIIFIKNDINAEAGQKRRWVNGTIAKIYDLQENEVQVEMENGDVHNIVPERWENRIFKFDPHKRRITSEVVGTFLQYPVKLAWAITIHKSQGLTFDKLHLNTGYGAFAHGQTYVALSRCRTMQGLTLKKPVRKDDIILDQRVMRFYRKHFINQEAYMKEHEIIELVVKHPEIFKLMFAIHYPFTVDELTKYQEALPYGKSFYTRFDEDRGKVEFSEFGLVFNKHIDWKEVGKQYSKATGNKKFPGQGKVPLDIDKELQARLDAITQEAMVKENYKKAGRKAKELREAKSFIEKDVPSMTLKDLEDVISRRENLAYVLSASLFANNIAERINRSILHTVMDYLGEQKIIWKHK